MGPNDAPTMVKKLAKLAAAPVIARIIAMVTPIIVELMRDTRGIIVEKLFPAIKAQKQLGVTEANAKRKNIKLAIPPPIAPITSPYVRVCRFESSARAPATEKRGKPPAIRMG